MPLRVTVEVIPHGDTSRTEKIGHLYITQVGKMLGDLREYEVADCLGDDIRTWHVQHRRSGGAMELVRRAIAERPT